jgi:hypothetical protein
MERKSWRVVEFAERHGISRGHIYNQIAAGLLNARKSGQVTIVTDEDERAWLAAMPRLHPVESSAA